MTEKVKQALERLERFSKGELLQHVWPNELSKLDAIRRDLGTIFTEPFATVQQLDAGATPDEIYAYTEDQGIVVQAPVLYESDIPKEWASPPLRKCADCGAETRFIRCQGCAQRRNEDS